MSDIETQIKELEQEMASPTFWDDKTKAQEGVRYLNELKGKLAETKKYDRGNTIITIFAGAGGADAEDWARMLFEMYQKFAGNKGFSSFLIHKNENDHGGFRNITFELIGKNAYGMLKNESGVHRLVRVSPFSARKLRHTSFAMVEVIPKFEKKEIVIPPEDVKIEFARSSGPGGQNVNKRETAVRVVHIPTGIAVHCESERSQQRNKERAIEILSGKIYRYEKEVEEKKKAGFYISKETSAEWGSQIRSYVLHPYKLVKDHRTNVEHTDPSKVLGEGDLDLFIEAEHDKEF